MFFVDSENEKEGDHLRIEKRFWLGKRRRTVTRRGICSTAIGEEYGLKSYFDEGSYNEEEGY